MEGKWLAAVRHCGARAALSHGDAAALWGIASVGGSLIHVTTPARSGREPRLPVRLHRVGSLRTGEVTVRDAIPVTTVARTLLDLAATAGPRRLEDLVAQADRLRLFDLGDVRRVVDAHQRQPGRRKLIALLAQLEGGGPADMRNRAEEALLELCDDYGLPTPRANVMVAGYMVDFLWPAAKLIAETDGFTYHSMPTQFASDRERDQLLMLAGYRVARFTYHQFTRRTERPASARRLRALLLQSGSL